MSNFTVQTVILKVNNHSPRVGTTAVTTVKLEMQRELLSSSYTSRRQALAGQVLSVQSALSHMHGSFVASLVLEQHWPSIH